LGYKLKQEAKVDAQRKANINPSIVAGFVFYRYTNADSEPGIEWHSALVEGKLCQ